MGFGIYTGGTTGLTDGTLVSASNKLTFPSITTVLDAHIRCGEDEYSAQIDFDNIPSELEISFNAGGVWYGIGEAPFYAATSQGPGNSDVWDVNYPIKLRQVAVPVTADDTFTTDGTVSACTALSTPTLTATPGDTLIDLSWTNVANEDGYTLDRSTASDFSANLVSVSKGAGVTTHQATGLTNGVTYYFRVKAEGSGRYSDSGYGTDDAVPTSLYHRIDLFTDTNGTALTAHSPTGGEGTWTEEYTAGTGTSRALRVKDNRVLCTVTAGNPANTTLAYWLSASSNADCAAEVDGYLNTSPGGAQLMVACRGSGASYAARNEYRLALIDDGGLTLAKMVAGTYTVLDTASLGALTTESTYKLRVEAIGTTIKGYVNDVEQCSATDSSVSSGGRLALQVSNSSTTGLVSGSATGWSADAVRLYNI